MCSARYADVPGSPAAARRWSNVRIPHRSRSAARRAERRGLGRIGGLEDCEHAIADQLENIPSAFMHGRDDNLGVFVLSGGMTCSGATLSGDRRVAFPDPETTALH